MSLSHVNSKSLESREGIMISNQAQNRPSIGFLDERKKGKKKKKNPHRTPCLIRTVAFCAMVLGRELLFSSQREGGWLKLLQPEAEGSHFINRKRRKQRASNIPDL